MGRFSWRILLPLAFSLALVLGAVCPALTDASAPIAVQISSTPIGKSTRYIGACEGNVDFEPADLVDLGINTYRIYGGMSRWELEEDDGVYGSPSIAQIKQNPNIIPWDRWDSVMSAPKTGSDYAFSKKLNDRDLWQGSARTIFEALKQNNIRPVITIRNVDSRYNPAWARRLNPPNSEADRNEWWEHVFATVYWLNVRNDYRVDDFEIHNEPDAPTLGWQGNQNDYFELVRIASEAIAYVYNTYLPERTFHIHAPKTRQDSRWPKQALASIPNYFDTVNVHNYSLDVSTYTRRVRNWIDKSELAYAPLWIGEWGTYTAGYSDLEFSLNLIKNLIRMSQPGYAHVYGSHLFSLYDWGHDRDFEGLINAQGDRTLSYYAFRMAIRALQGGRNVLQIASSDPSLTVMATQQDPSTTFLLLVNPQRRDRNIEAYFPNLTSAAQVIAWEFSQSNLDTPIATLNLEEGSLSFGLPAKSSRLIRISSS